jgi:hypothetical protein
MKGTRTGHRVFVIIAAVAAMLLVLPMSVFCISLDAYKARVDAALLRAFELERILRLGEIDDPRKMLFIAPTRSEFPAAERIEWAGGSVETSHEWLLARVNELESASDVETSLPIIVGIREHLSAIAFKLEEMQTGVESGRTKDEDKQKLSEILQLEEYQKPEQAEESAFQRALRNLLEWFMDLWPKPQPSSPQTVTGFGSIAQGLQIVLILILVGLLIFLIYKLISVFFPSLKRRTKRTKPKKRIILGEEIGEDEVASDLFGEAERLAQAGDIRGAIRKGYIALLCDLSDRRIIGLARHKTNRDYLRDVRSRRELHPRMKSVTDTFERHWYGAEKSEREDWTHFSEGCREAIRSA